MFSSNTFTRGSPNVPRARPAICRTNTVKTCSVVTLRAAATDGPAMPPNRADFRVKTRAGRRQHIRVNGLAGQLGRFPVTSGRYNLQTPFDRHLIGSATATGA